ncbi:35849_t:CDS:2 [Gigaspora margarita]|uniref:35849_t:CDS:1 n=1 Tax=Gigaspora margarita TaxID=4874 RepID=A0ABN7UE28_GIGMA|nr:35849_t:CDS:2 [Gigaspora margarita]
MTETKLADTAIGKLALTNPYYKEYTTNYDSSAKNVRKSSLGIGILLVSQLQPYIYNIEKVNGMVLMLDLYLSRNTQLRIISINLLSNNIELSRNTQIKVQSWAQQARRRGIHIVIMGDFNDNVKRPIYKRQTPLLANLNKNNLINSIDFMISRSQPGVERTVTKDLVSGVIVDKKKKIHVEIEKLLEHQLQKKQTKIERYYEGVWLQKERQIYEVTRLFSEIADELWKGFLIKGVLRIIQIKNIELEIRFEDRVMITSQLEEVITDMEVQYWLTNTHLLTMDRVLVIKMIKILTNELLVAMNMYIRNPAQNSDATCPRCEKKAKDDRHWIICKANMITLDKIIRQAVDRCLSVIEGKKTRQMGNEQYKAIYMSSESKLKIGIITKTLYNPLGAINDQRHNIELYYNIISKLYIQIWISSCQVRKKENRREGRRIPQLNKIRTLNGKGEQYYRSWVIDFIKNNTKAVQLDSVVQ